MNYEKRSKILIDCQLQKESECDVADKQNQTKSNPNQNDNLRSSPTFRRRKGGADILKNMELSRGVHVLVDRIRNATD